MRLHNKLSILVFFIFSLFIFLSSGYAQKKDYTDYDLSKAPHVHKAGVDHSKFPELQKKFNSPHEVTETCISCHNKRDDEFMKTPHWLWKEPVEDAIHGKFELGKADVLNNFCIGIRSNEPRCTSCHAGYGWKDKNFDFSDAKNIDCLVCHDQTGTYKKYPAGAGYPVTEEKTFPPQGGTKKFFPPDYNKVAQSVGLPKRNNCGTCHYNGGGGNNVKHGDLEKALNKTTKKVDVHMGIDGGNMQCIECHKTYNHQIPGTLLTIQTNNQNNRVYCEDCHKGSFHKKEIIDKHLKKVACQTCHIPVYAKVNPTKMWWDWSKAGLNTDGKPIAKYGGKELNKSGHPIDGLTGKPVENFEVHNYLAKKGEFIWEVNAIPDYVFSNGTATHVLLTDKIDDTKQPLVLNKLGGSYKDGKIIPVKIFKGKQIYDKKFKNLIQPKLFGKKGSGAFWADFDWGKAAEKGMEYIEQKYSGEYGFIETESFWPVNHMVSPKEDALKCQDCHKQDGRLAKLKDPDLYVPGRDKNAALDTIGWALVLLTLIGVLGHGFARMIFTKKN